MEQNNSCHSSANSADTDVLIKIPNNFFDPNLNLEKTHFSTETDFMTEIDNFLHVEHHKEALNSTGNDVPSYKSFSETLHRSGDGKGDQLDLEEEKLKRIHYEQLCGLLQKKIQQYQQKLAFLMKLDQEKDQAIQRLKSNEGLDVENNRLKLKIVNLEREISETIQLINKFQTKNEMLELKIENLTATSAEMRDISKKQIHDLEIRFTNSKSMEVELHKEIEDLKLSVKTEKENFIKEKHSRSLLDREVNSLKSQLKQAKDDKLKLLERHDKEKQNLEMKQKKIFSNMMNEFGDKERKLLGELDMQRAALKNYYQAQLETALEEKLIEFQNQLEGYQEEIKRSAEKRERSLNERTIQQVEMIVRK
jgi:DNA repair exonuclease SbcCD ATPase subunit